MHDSMIECLAAGEHEQWAHWYRYFFYHSSPETIARWDKQSRTPYESLSEAEKDRDREWAERAWEIMTEKVGVVPSLLLKDLENRVPDATFSIVTMSNGTLVTMTWEGVKAEMSITSEDSAERIQENLSRIIEMKKIFADRNRQYERARKAESLLEQIGTILGCRPDESILDILSTRVVVRDASLMVMPFGRVLLEGLPVDVWLKRHLLDRDTSGSWSLMIYPSDGSYSKSDSEEVSQSSTGSLTFIPGTLEDEKEGAK